MICCETSKTETKGRLSSFQDFKNYFDFYYLPTLLEIKFCSFPSIFSYVGHLPVRSSSIEVVFNLFKNFKMGLSTNGVDLSLLESKF